MSIRRTRRNRTATVLAGVVAATLTGVGAATAAPTETTDGSPVAAAPDDEPSRTNTLPGRSARAIAWPAELTEHTRLFVNPYRSYLVQERDGVPTLVLSTGWDSCYFMTQHGQQRYPC